MNTYRICVTEYLERVLEIKADNVDTALRQVAEMFDSEEVVLTADDFSYRDIDCIECIEEEANSNYSAILKRITEAPNLTPEQKISLITSIAETVNL